MAAQAVFYLPGGGHVKSHAKTASGRGVYSFCMCPGGQIVPTSLKPGELCVNGMSYSNRGSKWANSAIVVSVGASHHDYEVEEQGTVQDAAGAEGVAAEEAADAAATAAGGGFPPALAGLRFQEEMDRFRELRFSDYSTESIDINPGRTQATAVVRFRGYWLSSPFEREIRVVQRWRRQVPTQNWYVTPDFDALLGPTGS